MEKDKPVFMSVKGEYDGKYFYITFDLAKEIYHKYKTEIVDKSEEIDQEEKKEW